MEQKDCEAAQADAGARKIYARPELVVYGTVKKLVQSGCALRQENQEHRGLDRDKP